MGSFSAQDPVWLRGLFIHEVALLNRVLMDLPLARNMSIKLLIT